MVKFSKLHKLSRPRQQEILISFCKALAAIKNSQEAAQFLKDLLSEQEAEMLAKRLEIARFLLEGKTYGEIQIELKVSHGTVARVSTWLSTSGEGYRLIIQRTPEEKERKETIKEIYDRFSWRNIKRRYRSKFWLQLALEEMAKTANKKQKEKLLSILSRFGEKSKIYDELNVLLREEYRPKVGK